MLRTPRGESLRYTRQTELVPLPDPDEYRDLVPYSTEALDYLKSIKPRRYASLAKAMDRPVTEAIAAHRAHRKTDYFWRRVGDSMLTDFRIAQRAASASPEYQNAQRFNEIVGLLSPDSYFDLSTLVLAGMRNAIITKFTLLRNLPQLMRYHQSAAQGHDPSVVARQSVGLPWRLAMLSSQQMIGAQIALTKHLTNNVWHELDATLDPTQFQLIPHTDTTASLSYADLDNATLPAGRTTLSTHAPTATKHIPPDGVTIGCPITLFNGRMQELWEYDIALVEREGLWDEDFPAAA